MQVFKTYFKIFMKHKLSIIIYAILFLGITSFFSQNLLKEDNKKFSTWKVPILVINEDGNSELIQGFLSYLGNYADFINVDDNDMARKDALFYQKVKYVLTIPAGFTKDFIAGKDASFTKQTIPDATASYPIDTAVDTYLNTARIYLDQVPGISEKELVADVSESLAENTKVTMNTFRGDEKSRGDSFNVNYFNYLAYIIIAIFIIGVSNVMDSFNRITIRRKHQASPISNRRINLQLIFANLIFIMGYLTVFLIANYISNPYRRIDSTTVMFWINSAVFAIVALSLSYLIGITVKGRKAINAISTAASLSLAFLSGVFVPQEYLGAAVLKVASFTPSYWFVKANNAIGKLTVYNWDSLTKVFGFMAIQLGFAAAILSIVLVVSKRRSQQAY